MQNRRCPKGDVCFLCRMRGALHHLDVFSMTESPVFVCEYISHLIRNALGLADKHIDISVGMPINPIFDRACRDKATQLDYEGSVKITVFELGRHQFVTGNMVCCYDNMVRRAILNTLVQEVETPVMLFVEMHPVQERTVELYSFKVSDRRFRGIGVVEIDLGPQCG